MPHPVASGQVLRRRLLRQRLRLLQHSLGKALGQRILPDDRSKAHPCLIRKAKHLHHATRCLAVRPDRQSEYLHTNAHTLLQLRRRGLHQAHHLRRGAAIPNHIPETSAGTVIAHPEAALTRRHLLNPDLRLQILRSRPVPPMAAARTGRRDHAQGNQHAVPIHSTMSVARLNPQGNLPRLSLRQHAMQTHLPL